MKKCLMSLVAVFLISVSLTTAQVQQVNLEQVKGEFTTESLTLASGKYQFNISNTNVDHEVGFVLVPKGKYAAAYHIKDAYVKAPVAKGKTSATNVVNLESGAYEYFCPLNPTSKYSLNVVADVKTLSFSQVPGAFEAKNIALKTGAYQFEVSNKGVDHEVGFVLVPKGKYDSSDHIKAAYVKAPVANGTQSKTGIIELAAGEYEYFCPLNPTPKYSLTVK